MMMWECSGGGGDVASSSSSIWWHRWCHCAVIIAVDVVVVVVTQCHHHHCHFSGIGSATVPSLLLLTWGCGGGDMAVASSLLSHNSGIMAWDTLTSLWLALLWWHRLHVVIGP